MSKPFNKLRDPKLNFDDVLRFGRHHGYTVSEVLKDRPQYIAWLIDNTDIKFTDQVMDLADVYCPPKPRKIIRLYRDESHNVHSDQDDWFDDIPF